MKDGSSEIMTADEFYAVLESDAEEALIVGDVDALGDSFFHGLHHAKTGAPTYPAAEALVELAAGRAERGGFPHPDEIRPIYLREPDVAISWKSIRKEGPWPGSD